MKLGKQLVYECPECKGLIKKMTIAVGNNLYLEAYSDRKKVFPMNPEFPDLTICDRCSKIFYLSKSKLIGEFMTEKEEIEAKRFDLILAKRARFLTPYEYSKALDMNFAETQEQEKVFRIKMWWAFNDRVRNGGKLFALSDEDLWTDNLNKLLPLLSKDDIGDTIMTAEINRCFGNFSDSIDIFKSVYRDELSSMFNDFSSHCENKNTLVFRFNFK